MTEDHQADALPLQRQLDLLHELEALLREQNRTHQATVAETRRLHLAMEAAVTRLGAMLSGNAPPALRSRP